MPVLHLQHNNTQLFINVLILPLGTPADLIGGQTDLNGPTKPFRALVDTGATSSCITTKVASAVGLDPVGRVSVQGVAGVADLNNYLFHVGFIENVQSDQGQTLAQVNVLNREITGAEVNSGGHFDVLLGMDVLSTGTLIVHGNKHFSFSF